MQAGATTHERETPAWDEAQASRAMPPSLLQIARSGSELDPSDARHRPTCSYRIVSREQGSELRILDTSPQRASQ